MFPITRKFLILLVGVAFAAVPQMLVFRPSAPLAPPAAAATITPDAASCGPPPVVTRRPRPEEEGCSETPSPALARR